MIGFELDDPRLIAVEVIEALLSPDGRHATVRIAAHGDAREQDQALAALEHARHYLRHELAARLSLRHVPELHFDLNRNPDVESRVDLLLKRARKSRGEK